MALIFSLALLICNTVVWLGNEQPAETILRFPTAKHFASWLGLCPDNRITGGKIMSSKTQEVKSRSAESLRLAAQSLWRAKNYLGDCFGRWKARLGTAKAITVMAHKTGARALAPAQVQAAVRLENVRERRGRMKKKKLARLQNVAATLNYQFVPNT